MKTFKEWIEKNHPETIDESFWKKAGAAALIAGALTGCVNKPQAHPSCTNSSYSQRIEKSKQDLLIAAKKAGVPRDEWSKLKGQKVGGIVVVVNGRKVPLTNTEKNIVKAVEKIRDR